MWREDSEHCLNEFQRQAWAAAISTDTRDGHETLRLLLQPPRSLCASTGHYPYLPSREPVQPTTARVLWSRDNFPRRAHSTPQASAMLRWHLLPQAHPASPTPPFLPASVSQSPLISCSFNLVLSEQRTDALRRPTCSQGQIQSWTPAAVQTMKRKGNLSQQPQEQRIKSPQSTWCTLHLWNTWIDNESYQNWGGGLWEQL